MNIIRFFIHKPVTVAVGVIMTVLFGLIGFQKLPVQLTPDVETPLITVNTAWYGATPYEIEKEIIERQGKVLKGLQGLTEMESSSFNGLGTITRARELIPLFNRVIRSIPGVFGVSIQAGIFESGIGKGRTVDVNISGDKMDDIIQAAYALFGTISSKMVNTQVRPIPSLLVFIIGFETDKSLKTQ